MFKLQDQGWYICRQRIARIESCEAWVSDFEMVLIAKVMSVSVLGLLPIVETTTQPLYVALSNLLDGQVKTLASPDEILTDRGLRCLPHEIPGSDNLSSVADNHGAAPK